MAEEQIQSVKISELPLVGSYVNLYTIGTDGYLNSVKVPLYVLSQIGNLNNLTTTDKSSLVAAINEAARTGGGGGGGAAVLGFIEVPTINDLPIPGQPTIGYLVGTDLYLYVGSGGDTRGGAYKDCGPFRGPQGPQGIQGNPGPQGPVGPTGAPGGTGPQGPVGPAGVTSATIEVSPSTGTPTATVNLVNGILQFAFGGLKGETGGTGPAGPQGPQGPSGQSVTGAEVTVLPDSGTPSAAVTFLNGLLSFVFNGLKGADGRQGVDGEPGPPGVTSAVISVDNTSGTPSAQISVVDGVLTIALSGIKGAQGNSGYSGAAGELQVVNNLTQGGTTDALSAEMGKVLKEELDGKLVFMTEEQFEQTSSFAPNKIYCTYEDEEEEVGE